MKLIHKRLILSFFAALFIVISALALTYGLGYRYNFDKKKFEATGILFVKTYPRQSVVWLNGEKLGSGTPLQESYLSPGHYNLTISKDGFFDWSKIITIYPHTTTFVEDVILFKSQAPQNLKSFSLEQSLPLSDNRCLFLGRQDDDLFLWLFNPDSEQFNTLKKFSPDDQVKLISLSPNNKKIIYQWNGQYWLLNLETPSVDYRLTGINSLYYQDFQWDASADNIIYSLLYQSLYRIDLTTSPVKITQQYQGVEFFFPYQGKIYICREEPGETKLTLLALSSNLTDPVELAFLPLTDRLELVPDGANLTLLDSANRFLYLINLDKKDLLVDIVPNVKAAKWYQKTNDKIVTWNDNEISIYYLAKQSLTLVDRVTSPIQNVWWHGGGTYLFYQTNDEINIIELDERDKKNHYTLAPLATDLPLLVNSKGDKIFYYAAAEQEFYRQEIQ
jgi:hypothetical protein